MKKTILLLASLLVAAACGGAQTPDPTQPGPTASGSVAPTSPAPTGASTNAPPTTGTDLGKTTAPTTPPAGMKMKAITPTEMGPALKELGIDVKSLPPLNKIPPDKIRKVMNTFTKALGTQCTGCHDGDDFKKATPNKKVAARMWNEFVRGYSIEGGAVYCDSCHAGKMTFLVRDPGLKELSTWMDDNFVGKMKNAKGQGGQGPACETCHGDPVEGKFLHNWKK